MYYVLVDPSDPDVDITLPLHEVLHPAEPWYHVQVQVASCPLPPASRLLPPPSSLLQIKYTSGCRGNKYKSILDVRRRGPSVLQAAN